VRTFVVFGGAEVGAVEARQLKRAMSARRLETARIVVVDRDPDCLLSADPGVELEVADWSKWLFEKLDTFSGEDHLVPYHYAPHLFLSWLWAMVEARGGRLERLEVAPRGLPWEAPTRSGDRGLSYAAWKCPALCIEPDYCPATRGLRDWDLERDLREAAGPDETIVLPCLHLAYGVSTLPVSRLLQARERMVGGLGAARNYLVATSSRCHALAARVRVQASQ
jgi:hypothetical protein